MPPFGIIVFFCLGVCFSCEWNKFCAGECGSIGIDEGGNIIIDENGRIGVDKCGSIEVDGGENVCVDASGSTWEEVKCCEVMAWLSHGPAGPSLRGPWRNFMDYELKQ